MKFNPDYSNKESLLSLYQKPLLELVFEAATIHRKYHNPREVQMSSLLSIKTGGCPEDCGYCPQAARYHTDVDAEGIMKVEDVLEQAKNAKWARDLELEQRQEREELLQQREQQAKLEAEQLTRQLREEMEQKMKENIDKLMQEQLRQSKKQE